MRTLLLNLPWMAADRSGVRAGSRWPFTSRLEEDGSLGYVPFPFFMAYADSLLKKENKGSKIIDAIAERMDSEALFKEVLLYGPQLIVTETSTPSFENDISILKELKERLPLCRIALCGPHASAFPAKILQEYAFIDHVLFGEYEFTLLDLVKRLESGQSFQAVPGLVFRLEGRIILNKHRNALVNLDKLPWPDRKPLPMYKYNDGFCGLPRPNVQMQSSRGCPFGCIFCLWPQAVYRQQRYRKRNPSDVATELQYLIKEYGFKAAYFDDDLFNADRDHVFGMCGQIHKLGIKIPWAAMARADLMDPKMLEVMAGAGLYALKYGIESADPKIQRFCRKNLNLKKSVEMIRLTKRLGVKVHLTFCLGLPGETKETIRQTKAFINDMAPDSVQVSFATPFPGTEYFKQMQASGKILSRSWPDFDGNRKCVIKTASLSALDLESERAELLS
jgi:radical SAM superfamily enzyme YgiQ (UPF0313 family)